MKFSGNVKQKTQQFSLYDMQRNKACHNQIFFIHHEEQERLVAKEEWLILKNIWVVQFMPWTNPVLALRVLLPFTMHSSTARMS